MTVGVKTNEGVDETFFGLGWPGFGVDTLLVDDNYWWVPQGAPQGVPDASGQVLIGQFSTLDGTAIGGTFQVSWFDGQGTPFNDVVEFSHPAAPLCPWDCDSGESDFDGGGVGITDFLELLANWGPCP